MTDCRVERLLCVAGRRLLAKRYDSLEQVLESAERLTDGIVQIERNAPSFVFLRMKKLGGQVGELVPRRLQLSLGNFTTCNLIAQIAIRRFQLVGALAAGFA